MIDLKSKKRGSIPVVLVVVLTIALFMFALVSFYLSSNKINSKIEDYRFLDDLYSDADEIQQGYLDMAENPLSIKKIEKKYKFFGEEKLKYFAEYLIK